MKSKDEIYFNPEGSPVVPDKFDVRVQLRHRSRGVITADALKKFLASLPDDAAHGTFIEFDAIISDEKDSVIPGGTTH
ncbi:MAG: hypothetical protein JST16_13695 [Bdellovibrionales bacterium]|nr:hypothetical protein [Bdellovibrionales bacterium]